MLIRFFFLAQLFPPSYYKQMEQELIINSRFNGPPETGNGGYVCGLIAGYIEGTAEVTLRKPPPLNKPLTIKSGIEGSVQLMDGETLIGFGGPSNLNLDVISPPTLAEAKAAVPHYTGFNNHFFPTCFVCGPQRSENDGLQIYPGQVEGQAIVASPWRPAPDLSDGNGRVQPQFVWAALDCPGAFAIMSSTTRPVVLGRLTAQISQPIYSNQEYIVSGWAVGQDGRKYYAGTAVYNSDGSPCAFALATWIAI